MSQRFVLDTGIIFGYLTKRPYAEYVEKTYSPLNKENVSVISVVTIGELLSLAKGRNWGQDKIANLEDYLSKIPTIDINNKSILESYAEIDAFSQCKIQDNKPDGHAVKMGKNDLWIASTANVLKATLLTTDKDFEHLNNKYLNTIYIDPKGIYNQNAN